MTTETTTIDRAAVMTEARRQYQIMGPLGWTFRRRLARRSPPRVERILCLAVKGVLAALPCRVIILWLERPALRRCNYHWRRKCSQTF